MRYSTYPIGAASRKINLSWSCAENSSSRPTYSQVIALVGRIAHDKAAINKANFLETLEILVGATLIQGQ